MRTSGTYQGNSILPWGIDIRFVLITIFTIVFYAQLAASSTSQTDFLYHYLEDNNEENYGWIGEKQGDYLILELDAISIANFEILLDGTPYNGQLIPHQEKNIYVYNFNEIGQNTFFLHEFLLDGKTIGGKFENPMALLEYLNEHTDIDWSYDIKRGLLFCSNDLYIYNEMMISTLDNLGEVRIFQAASTRISKNVAIKIPTGNHTVTVNNFVTGHKESKELFVAKEMAFN